MKRTDTDRLDWIGQHLLAFHWGLNCLFIHYLDNDGVGKYTKHQLPDNNIGDAKHFRNALNRAMDECEGK